MEQTQYETRGLRRIVSHTDEQRRDPINLLREAAAWKDPEGMAPNLLIDAIVEACMLVKEKYPKPPADLNDAYYDPALRATVLAAFDEHLPKCPDKSMSVKTIGTVCKVIPEAFETLLTHAEKFRVRSENGFNDLACSNDLQDMTNKIQNGMMKEPILSKGGRFYFGAAIKNPDGEERGDVFLAAMLRDNAKDVVFCINGMYGTDRSLGRSVKQEYEENYCQAVFSEIKQARKALIPKAPKVV